MSPTLQCQRKVLLHRIASQYARRVVKVGAARRRAFSSLACPIFSGAGGLRPGVGSGYGAGFLRARDKLDCSSSALFPGEHLATGFGAGARRPVPDGLLSRSRAVGAGAIRTASSSPSPSGATVAANGSAADAPTFQQAIERLQQYWSAACDCAVWLPHSTEVGAGTMNPATFLRVLGPEPWNVCYPEPSIRPDDSRFGDNPNRVQRHTQFQVILKPEPGNAQELLLGSFEALGIDVTKHDVRFVEGKPLHPHPPTSSLISSHLASIHHKQRLTLTHSLTDASISCQKRFRLPP